jgi:hypothetical protein
MGNDRTGGPLQAADRGVGVDGDHKAISQRARGGEIADMTDVKKIETAVGEDDPLPLLPERTDSPLKRGKSEELILLCFNRAPVTHYFSSSVRRPAIRRGSIIS